MLTPIGSSQPSATASGAGQHGTSVATVCRAVCLIVAVACGGTPQQQNPERPPETAAIAPAMETPPTPASAQTACAATARSLTPPTWNATPEAPRATPMPGLQRIADIPLPGPANRFDYQSVDSTARRLYISHMNAGTLLVVDLDSERVVREVSGVSRVTGVLSVPSHHHVYASAAGSREVAIINDQDFSIAARVSGLQFPDGLAYAAGANKVFVSDERGGASIIIDAGTLQKRASLDLGGEAGNTHFDRVSGCVVVAVQSRGELVAIDPWSEKIVARYAVPGVDQPHGFVLDEARRLAFVTGEGNASLAVIDLKSMRVIQRFRVGAEPDVLAWDAGWRRLYVASESGIVSAFWAAGDTLLPLGDEMIPHAHSVSVDPRTHRIYLPLENINGKPILRVLAPAP